MDRHGDGGRDVTGAERRGGGDGGGHGSYYDYTDSPRNYPNSTGISHNSIDYPVSNIQNPNGSHYKSNMSYLGEDGFSGRGGEISGIVNPNRDYNHNSSSIGGGIPGIGMFPPHFDTESGPFLGGNSQPWDGGRERSGWEGFKVPLSGQKRGYPSTDRGREATDESDGGNFVRLYVGPIPRTATKEEVRPLFEEHGRVLEVAILRYRKPTQQGCCFIKYATVGEANRAIRALHDKYILPGDVGPTKVRFPHGELERLDSIGFNLYVGSLGKQATVKEVEEIFKPYGLIIDVCTSCMMYSSKAEGMKRIFSKLDDSDGGYGFVKYPSRDMATAAINALSGIYTMRGSEKPLTVRFAVPKRHRVGESRPPANLHDPPNVGSAVIPQNLEPPSYASGHGFGVELLSRCTDATNASASVLSTPQQGSDRPLPQALPVWQVQPPSQMPLQSHQNFPSSIQLHPQVPAPYVQSQTSHSAPSRPYEQVSVPHSASHAPFSQTFPSQHMYPTTVHMGAHRHEFQQNFSSCLHQTHLNNNLQQHVAPTMSNQQQLPALFHQQPHYPLLQSPYQLSQNVLQQTQALQGSFELSQPAFSQPQHQFQEMQPANHTQASKTNSRSENVQKAGPIQCNWTEHISQDGYIYYYNSFTGESKWEKPEELAFHEQYLKQLAQQPPVQSQPEPQGLYMHKFPPAEIQLQSTYQAMFQPPQQPQQYQQFVPSSFPPPGAIRPLNAQEYGSLGLQSATGSINDPVRFQQGFQASQE